MKFPVRYYALTWSPWRRQLRLHGRRNNLQVLETALVVEGLVAKVDFPIVMPFIYPAISEWTTRTIPYSRIIRHRWRRRRLTRIVVALLAGCLAMAVARIMRLSTTPLQVVLAMAVCLGVWLVARAILKSYHELDYLFPDGHRCGVRVGFRRRGDAQRFDQLLSQYRSAAADLQKREQPKSPDGQPPGSGRIVAMSRGALLQRRTKATG